MKKQLFILFYLCLQVAFGQTNIAVPSYSATTSNGSNPDASTGNIKFYRNGVSQTLTVGRGANGVCFYGNDMFVAIADGIGTKGIIWYANVSFASGTFSSSAPIVLANNQDNFSVSADASGNIYSANYNGTVTKFIRNNIAPFYSAANVVNTAFWSNGGFAEVSGVFVDTATQTLWAVSYANSQGAVVKLSDFNYVDGFGNNTKIKRFGDNANLIQKPEGIAKDASGNIWIGNNHNHYVLRLNNSVVTSFVNDLNAADYSFITLNNTQLNDFAVSATNHQLGGLVYDNLYSSKMYVNDQISNGTSAVYSFEANNSAPTFTATAMTQIYPGAGQCAIIPCALLPTPSNPTAASANPSTINVGQSSILIASGCSAGTTYRWKEGATIINAFDYTPSPITTTTYTAHCVSGGTCESSGIPVTVTVNPAVLSVTANPTTICQGAYSFLTATGCGGSVSWNNGVTATSMYVYPNTTTTYTATCSAGGSSSATVTVNPNPALTITSSVPIFISDCGGNEVVYLHANQTTTLTASGCTGTIKWEENTNTYSGTTLLITAPSLNTELGIKNIFITCTNSNGCISNSSMGILNQFATDDNYTTALNTPVSGNVITNDTETSVAWGAYGPTTTAHGTITWVLGTPRPTGAFTYTPNNGFQGVDTFTYFVSDDLTCSKRATVTITVGNPCPNTLTVSASPVTPNYGANEVVKASEYINTFSPPNIVISPTNSNNLTYQAGKSVTLSAGFSVSNGAVFTAQIGGCSSTPAHQTFYTQGKDIYAPNGQKIVLRGVNYPVLDDYDFPASDKITEIEKSKANAIRLPWWINYNDPNRPAYTLTDLDNLLAKCKVNKMIPILSISDYTCGEDMAVLNSAIVPWWTSPAVVSVLNNHKQYVIINLANELGKYRWTNIYSGNSYNIAALNAWKNAYKTAITAIRAANLKMPIMIDGTDCGSDLKAFHQVGQEIIDHDPEHNIIFSGHAYWQYYPDQVADLNAVVAANVPLVFGEVANKQDDYNNVGVFTYCLYDLDDNVGYRYQDFLTYLQANDMSWLAWAWVRDGCGGQKHDK